MTDGAKEVLPVEEPQAVNSKGSLCLECSYNAATLQEGSSDFSKSRTWSLHCLLRHSLAVGMGIVDVRGPRSSDLRVPFCWAHSKGKPALFGGVRILRQPHCKKGPVTLSLC